jgi:SAM-dependent methyltransferase
MGAADDYDRVATAYDLLTAGQDRASWLAAIERLAREHGLRGRAVLDVACGTGKSFEPLLDRGYDVTATDGSPAMAAIARFLAAGRARVHVHDMRALPVLGAFHLITCLDDAINHLDTPADVLRTLRGLAANLAPGGLVAFDVSLLAAYASAGDAIVEDEHRVVLWRGAGARSTPAGGVAEIVVDLFVERPDGLWRRETLHQAHRHYPLAELRELAAAAGLRVAAVRAQRAGGVLAGAVDEAADRKALLLLAHA